MHLRSLGYTTDLMVLRALGSLITDSGDHLTIRTPSNPSYWWGNFILVPGPLQVGDGRRWRSVFAHEFPAARHLAVGIDTVSTKLGAETELSDLGGAARVDSVLTTERAPGRSAPAAAAEVRALSSQDDWRQLRDLRYACADDRAAEDPSFLDRSLAAEQRACAGGGVTWFGAFIEERLRSSLGIVCGDAETARYQGVETHPDYRRRGLASSLVCTAAAHALDRCGARTLVIVAERKADAIRLYRRLGFVERELQARVEAPPTPG